MLERRRSALLAAALASAGGALARPAPAQDVVVGSKNFPESRLLGEMLTLLIEEQTDLDVEHKASLGGTSICFDALREGDIDLYPEYTGTAWSVVLGETERVSDPMRTYFHVAARYRERYDLVWLSPFGLNNKYELAVDEARAEELGLRTISDLRAVGGSLRCAFSIEFMDRPDGYPGLAQYYGLQLGDVRAMEHGLAYTAVAAGEVDLIDAYSTDGKLSRYRLRMLEDDRGFFPPYHAAPVVRAETLAAHPFLREVLDRLAFRIDDERMRRLNYAVEEEKREFRDVAREFLAEEGLVSGGGGPRESGARPAGRGGAFLPFFLGRWRDTLRLTLEHVGLTAVAVLLAAALAIPLGIWIQRHALAERLALGAAGVVQTIPSLALLAFAITVPGLGLSVRSAVLALFLYAVLPILRNTHAGLRGVDPELVDAARALGLTPRQVLLRVQLPIATGTILAGVRTSAVVGVGVATLAAFIGAGGLGEPILAGLYLNDPNLILAGAVPAALLALLADAGLGAVERVLVPRGLRRPGDP